VSGVAHTNSELKLLTVLFGNFSDLKLFGFSVRKLFGTVRKLFGSVRKLFGL